MGEDFKNQEAYDLKNYNANRGDKNYRSTTSRQVNINFEWILETNGINAYEANWATKTVK